MADTVRDRFQRAMSKPQEDVSMKLARLLIGRLPADPVTVPAAPVPPPVTAADFARQPGVLPQSSAKVVQNTTPAPAAPPAGAPAQVMPPIDVTASPLPPEVPPMPASIPVGGSDGTVRGDLMAAVAAAAQKRGMAAPWTINQGTLADQKG